MFGGGIHAPSGTTTTLNNVTLTGNTSGQSCGGIHNNGSLTLNRNLIAGNQGPAAVDGDEVNNGGSVTSEHNLFGHDGQTTSEAISGFTTGSTDIMTTSDGTDPTALSDILDTSLTNNGGPTETHLPISSGPAIDAAPATKCADPPVNGLDQQGASRNYRSNCDAGAVELRERITQGTCGGSPLSGTQSFAFTGGTVTVDLTDGNGLTCLTIEAMSADHLIATTGLQTGKWWYFTGDVESGLDVAITLPYASADANSQVCRYPGGVGGKGWDCGVGSNTTFGSGTVTRANVTQLSDWSVGDNVGPTRVTLAGARTSTGEFAASLFWVFVAVCLVSIGAVACIRANLGIRRTRAPGPNELEKHLNSKNLDCCCRLSP